MKAMLIVLLALVLDAIIGLLVLFAGKKVLAKYLSPEWKRNLQWVGFL